MVPTLVGERVRFVAYSGEVPQYLVGATGTVTRFTRRNVPVVRLDTPNPNNPSKVVIYDRYDCGRVIDADGRLIESED